ncbi:MAG: sulfite exporter TauE/SafE family protein [Chloroflexi bacterium]|nr:sulfite exporter TauE/SafE family protein [Chloroflexota bacterium]
MPTCGPCAVVVVPQSLWESDRFDILPRVTTDAGFSLSPLLFVTALAAGMVSFASPCVLPLVPAYLGFITGRSAEEIARARGSLRVTILTQSFAFVLGLAVIFALLGASATLLGQTLLQNLWWLWKVGGVVVILLGLQMLGVPKIPALYRTARLTDVKPNSQRSLMGAFLMGIAFGAGWTPCVGPFLASLLALASSQETVGAGTALLLVYALGLGVPFLIAGLAVDRSLSVMRAVRPHMLTIERFSGALLIGMGVLLFTEQLTRITSLLTRVFGNGLAL